MTVPLDLSGTTAIVTGGGRGIGEEIATTFGDAGANVVVAARTTSEVEATADAIRDRGAEALAVTADITDVADVDAMIDEATDRFGPAEVLVNNAGVNLKAPFLEQSVEDMETVIDLNLRALLVVSQRFGRAFRASDSERGRIINISSIHGKQGIQQRTVYSGTKAGVFGVTRGLAASLAHEGITVNSVSPARTKVGRVDADADDDYDEIPAGRIGRPEDVAYACLYLASPLADYVSGEDIAVDGGISITRGSYENLPDR